MGCVDNITATRFPKQSRDLGARAEVISHYGGPTISGRIVRDDREEPWETIILLDDGRVVRATECQYHPVRASSPYPTEGEAAR